MKLLQPRAGFENFCVKVFVVNKNDLTTRRLVRDEYAFQNGTKRHRSKRIEEKKDGAIVVVGFRNIALANLDRADTAFFLRKR